ncbi:MAG: GNAT family N-acetyltransferase [Candidatus Rokubacteria bacterium]|nr:GNAT family N-acetyltransferase [Candidatus Rokubacteria bacterium]
MIVTLDRLVLREFERHDWEAVHVYGSDPEVVRYLAWGPNTERDSRTFVQHAIGRQLDKNRRHWGLAIVRKADEQLIGGCGVYVSAPEHREGWIGYCLRRDAWGHGYATEVGAALLAIGFTELRLHRVSATCDPRNAASARVLEKIGMRREAHLREHLWQKGEWRDSVVFGMLEQEFRPPARS